MDFHCEWHPKSSKGNIIAHGPPHYFICNPRFNAMVKLCFIYSKLQIQYVTFSSCNVFQLQNQQDIYVIYPTPNTCVQNEHQGSISLIYPHDINCSENLTALCSKFENVSVLLLSVIF